LVTERLESTNLARTLKPAIHRTLSTGKTEGMNLRRYTPPHPRPPTGKAARRCILSAPPSLGTNWSSSTKQAATTALTHNMSASAAMSAGAGRRSHEPTRHHHLQALRQAVREMQGLQVLRRHPRADRRQQDEPLGASAQADHRVAEGQP